MVSSQVGLGIAFLAGLASFLSPCILPLVPIYLIQLAGHSVYQAAQEEHDRRARLTTFSHAALFVLGFTLAFLCLGATASALGSFLRSYQILLREVGGVILVLFGLHLTGIFRIPFLYWQKRFDFRPNRPSYPASLLIGIIFAIGWTPCVGLILGPILALAANAATLRQGVLLLLFYSLGLGVPFLVLGLGLDRMNRLFTWLKPHLGKIEIVTGLVMIAAGVLIFFDMLPILNQYFNWGINV